MQAMLMTSAQTRVAKILVAEDQQDLREMISTTLRLAGHQVSAAPDGEAALRTAQEMEPDLIILDVHMPQMNAQQICEYLQANQALKNTRILLMSALATDKEIQAIVEKAEKGARGYMHKPFELDQLLQQVNSLLTTS